MVLPTSQITCVSPPNTSRASTPSERAAMSAEPTSPSLLSRVSSFVSVLLSPTYTQSVDSPTSLHSSRQRPLSTIPQGKIVDFPNPSELLLKELLRHESTRSLYEKACAIKIDRSSLAQLEPWSIKITFAQALEGNSQSQCNFKTRSIELNRELSFELALSFLVFELINATFYSIHQETYVQMSRKELSCRDYVYKCEKNEHQACLLHRTIVRDLNEKGYWPSRMNLYCDIPDDFEKYWPQIANTPHAQYYLDLYHRTNPTLYSSILARFNLLPTTLSLLPQAPKLIHSRHA